jgi:ribonuclease HII
MKKYDSEKIICGCDEAGRGALAGPVVAAAVILPNNFFHNKLNDSKKINEKLRCELARTIKEQSIAWGIGIIDNKKIDQMNILNASIAAMHKAIEMTKKKIQPKNINLLLIDGNQFHKYKNFKHRCIIKGDAKYYSIAAASILAKTHRDNIMKQLSKQQPEYNWMKNKGYPTKEHKNQIIKCGINKYHRKSFKLLETQYTLNL